MSDGVHWRRNSSGGSFGWSSGVSTVWNAYRWLLNISPGAPKAFFFSKLNTWATQSKTKTSSITARSSHPRYVPVPVADLGRRRQEPQDRGGPRGQAVGRPRLVPHDLHVGVGDAGLVEDPVADLGQHGGRERAPARGQQQFDPGPT